MRSYSPLAAIAVLGIALIPAGSQAQTGELDRLPHKFSIQAVLGPPPPLTLSTLGKLHINRDSTPNRHFPDEPKLHRGPALPGGPLGFLAAEPSLLSMGLGEWVAATVPAYDGGGQSGLLVAGGSNYTSIYANITAYTDLNLNAPPNATNQNVLYAPTVHGSDGNCLEAGSDYWSSYGYPGTARAFRLYDFCNNVGWNTNVSKPIDQTFVNAYVRTFSGVADNRPYYTIQLWKQSDGLWHLLLYNYTTSAWEDLYSTSGSVNYNGGQGWAIYETHYTPGACSGVPGAAAYQIQFDSTSAAAAPGVTHQNYGPCFTDTSASPYYVVTYPAGDTWTSLTY